MTFEQYIQNIFIPIMEAYRKIATNDESGFAKHFKNKIVTHACYALDGFNGYSHLFASERAQSEYQKSGNEGMIHDANVGNVKLSTGKPKYHYEHVMTNSMLTRLVTAGDDPLTLEITKAIIQANYCTAWILKTENDTLNANGLRSNRGSTRIEAINAYKNVGITLIDRTGSPLT